MIPALIIFDAVFNFSFIIKVIAMKPFTLKETLPLKDCTFLVQIQAAITGFLTFYWSRRTASPLLIQWTVRINRFWQLGSVHKILIHLEATSPFWLNSDFEYFEYNGPIASQTEKLRDLKKRILQHFLAKLKRSRDRDMFVYFVFIFIFVYIMLILKEFCISKGSHSKNLVNQPTLNCILMIV